VTRTGGHVFLQFVLLGTLSVTLNTSADIVVTLLAGPLGQRIRGSERFRRRQRTLTGAVMIGLGGYVAFAKCHHAGEMVVSTQTISRLAAGTLLLLAALV
jgi:threonine/homoserine/homoserine lactone efflux protein